MCSITWSAPSSATVWECDYHPHLEPASELSFLEEFEAVNLCTQHGI